MWPSSTVTSWWGFRTSHTRRALSTPPVTRRQSLYLHQSQHSTCRATPPWAGASHVGPLSCCGEHACRLTCMNLPSCELPAELWWCCSGMPGRQRSTRQPCVERRASQASQGPTLPDAGGGRLPKLWAANRHPACTTVRAWQPRALARQHGASAGCMGGCITPWLPSARSCAAGPVGSRA